jgi:hypothetical protein
MRVDARWRWPALRELVLIGKPRAEERGCGVGGVGGRRRNNVRELGCREPLPVSDFLDLGPVTSNKGPVRGLLRELCSPASLSDLACPKSKVSMSLGRASLELAEGGMRVSGFKISPLRTSFDSLSYQDRVLTEATP